MKIKLLRTNITLMCIYALLVISTGLGAISLGGGAVGNIRLWEVLLSAFVLVSFLKSCFDNRIVLIGSPTLLFVLGYLMAVFLSGINAIDITSWLQRVALVLAMSLLFFVFSQRSTQREFGLCLKLIVYSGIFFAFLGMVDVYLFLTTPDVFGIIHQFDGGRQFAKNDAGDLASYNLIARARGFFTEPNEFSQYLILPFGFILAMLFFRHQKTRWAVIFIIGILIVSFAQLFSLSRGGLLGFFGQFIGLFLIRNVSGVQWTLQIKKLLPTILLLFVIIGGVVYLNEDIIQMFDTVADRISSTGSEGDWTSDLRLTTIQAGFISAGTSFVNFLVGVGAGNLGVSYVREATTTNQFVDVLVETGIIGLTFYVAMILSLLWLSYKFMKNRLLTSNNELFVVFVGSYLSFVGMLLGGLTYATHALFFFWLNSGLLLAICKYGHIGLPPK